MNQKDGATQKKVLLVTGGSQGARIFSEIVPEAIPELKYILFWTKSKVLCNHSEVDWRMWYGLGFSSEMWTNGNPFREHMVNDLPEFSLPTPW